MKRIPNEILEKMATLLPVEERDEMAIPSYLHPNPAMRLMAWKRVEVIAKMIEKWFLEQSTPKEDRVIVDFGCGTGVLFQECLRHCGKIYGVDIVLEAARYLKKELSLERVELIGPDELDNRISDHSVDMVLAAEVLEHFESLKEPMKHFRRILKPDGRLFASVPTENLAYKVGRKIAGFQGDYHHSDARIIDRKIREFGFRRLRLEHVPFPGPASIYWVLEYIPVEYG